MAVLITGGAGFIGSNLCDLILKNHQKVIAIDNLTTGSLKNISSFSKNKNFTFIELDVCSEELINKLEKYSIDAIYHLASPAHVKFVTENPIQTALTNSLGTNNLLNIALKRKLPLLFASSSEVYGDSVINPQNENYWGNVNPIGVRSGYDEGKRFGESLCMAYFREHKIPIQIVRIFNTYGINSSISDSRVIPQFIMASIQNKPIVIHGDGSQTRSFCYVDDLIIGLKEIMDKKIIGPINLGNTDEITILALAKLIIKLATSSSKIKYVDSLPDDPKVRKPDISMAEKRIKWKTKHSLEEGIIKTIDYYRKLMSFSEKGYLPKNVL